MDDTLESMPSPIDTEPSLKRPGQFGKDGQKAAKKSKSNVLELQGTISELMKRLEDQKATETQLRQELATVKQQQDQMPMQQQQQQQQVSEKEKEKEKEREKEALSHAEEQRLHERRERELMKFEEGVNRRQDELLLLQEQVKKEREQLKAWEQTEEIKALQTKVAQLEAQPKPTMVVMERRSSLVSPLLALSSSTASELRHGRSSCQIFPFTSPHFGEAVKGNELCCEFCYCEICGIEANKVRACVRVLCVCHAAFAFALFLIAFFPQHAFAPFVIQS